MAIGTDRELSLDGVEVGPRSGAASEADDQGRILSPAELAELGISPPEELAGEMDTAPLADGNRVRVTGRFAGRSLLSGQGYRFKVLSNPDQKSPDLVGALIDIVARKGFEWLLEFLNSQAQQRDVTITDIELARAGEAFEIVDASTDWPMKIDISTVWNDTVVVFIGQTPYMFRPGEGKTQTIQKRFKGPNASERGVAHVRIVNTAGKAIEIVGNWSIDAAYTLSIGNKVVGSNRVSGYEPRGKEWTFGPFYFGARD
ncbi:hypothetical protein [Methylobacterium nigriterrae]|uniref:hypothetical protein n=1 Tax=Methylobacterium nigriterrae TaxID=3127512 RepID=UPI003013A4EC